MKRILLILLLLVIAACSEEERPDSPEIVEAFSISLTETCEPDDENFKVYCIDQETHDVISGRIRNLEETETCLWIDNLESINKNQIEGYVRILSNSKGPCKEG